jgi:hypothetical protein
MATINKVDGSLVCAAFAEEPDADFIAAVRNALPRLLDELERRRLEMKSMIQVPSYRCKHCGEMVPDNVPMVKEHLRSERHLAATGRK